MLPQITPIMPSMKSARPKVSSTDAAGGALRIGRIVAL